jgi:hypothetical protein
MPDWFSTQEELDEAIRDIKALSPATRKVLAKAIETQGYQVSRISPGARILEDLGFIFIKDLSSFGSECTLTPSLWGEEAYGAFEDLKGKK